MLLKAFSSINIKISFKPRVDNLVFRLHYRYTYIIFIGCVLLTTLYDWVGKSIECMIDVDSESLSSMVNSWCFIMGTFTVNKHKSGEVGKEVPFPGVGPYTEDDDITVHSYYQWVPFVLFFQAVVFYLPHWIWKGWENGLFRNIIMDLSIRDYLGNNLENYENRSTRYHKLAKYIRHHLNMHRMWAYKFFFCEFMNLFVTVAVFLCTNAFLGGEFTSYGTDIYIFIWVWLVFLMTVTSAWLLFRLATIIFPVLRFHLLKRQASRSLETEVRIVMEYVNLSDWFLIHTLGKNMDGTVFSEFITCLAGELKPKMNTVSAEPGEETTLL